MKKSVACLLFALAAGIAAAAPNVTNSVMMVGQRGNLNVEGVASVAEVASNAVKVTIAEEKAAAAQAAANGVTAALQTVAGNIMSNNVVIYRSGFSDSFSALVIFTPSDYLAIIDARWIEQGPSRIVVDVDYVSTADIGLVKPLVYHRNTLTNLVDFYQLADANVTMPVYHAESRTYKDDTFAGYYTIRATIPNPTGTDSYTRRGRHAEWRRADA